MVGSGRCRAVVFDFGGVLITPITNQLSVLAARHGVTTATMLEIVLGPHESGDHPWHRAERGQLAVADIQAELQPWADPHGVTLDGTELEEIMRGGQYTVIAPVMDKVASLKARGLLTGLLTNTFAEFRETMERDIRFGDFTHVIESFAVGARKPETEIYEITREQLGVAHEEILYLDDFPQNVAMARDLGWQTIHVTDPLEAIEAVDAFV